MERITVHENMPDAELVRKWLEICGRDDAGEHCKDCPWSKDPYENGCGKLLADASRLIKFLM